MFKFKKGLAVAGVLGMVLTASAAVCWIGLGHQGLFWFVGLWPAIVILTLIRMATVD